MSGFDSICWSYSWSVFKFFILFNTSDMIVFYWNVWSYLIDDVCITNNAIQTHSSFTLAFVQIATEVINILALLIL